MAIFNPLVTSFYEDQVMPLSKPFELDELMAQLGHSFSDPALLKEALIHPSLSVAKGQKKGESSPYERLEFLGDRVLGLVIAHWLYSHYTNADEGELAKRHASLVNRDALKKIAHSVELEKHLRLVRGESADASRKNLAALSDSMEAIIGALYLDGGLTAADNFIKKYWDSEIKAEAAPADPKTALQEYAQGKGKPLPEYTVLERSGPSHAPKFVIQVAVQGFVPVTAEGGSKREAEKAAALGLLEEIKRHAK